MSGAVAQHPATAGTLCFVLLALALTGPALLGRAALGPETVLDADPLYRTAPAPPLPSFDDWTPIVVDLPRELAVARGVRAGRLDKWNPLMGCGAPLWADHVGPFFPLKLLFYAAPSRQTYAAFLALRLVVAALGAYCLARRRGLGPTAAIAAGASFELSGALIAQLPFGSTSPTYMLPWVLLGALVIAQERSATATVGAAIALGITGTGGHPTLILMVFAGFAAAIAGHMLRTWRRPPVAFSIGAWALVAIALGLVLAAPSLLPLAELSTLADSYKYRPIGEMTWQAKLAQSRRSLPIALFGPWVFQAIYPNLHSLFTVTPFVGVLGLVAAVSGLVTAALDPALLCVAVLGLALTTAPPGLAWVAEAPGLHLILPTYAWTLVALPLTQAVGHGVDILSTARGRRVGLVALVLCFAGALGLWLASETGLGPKAFAALVRSTLANPRNVAAFLVGPVFAIAVLASCFALQRSRLASWTALVLAISIVLEQMVTMFPLVQQQPSAVLSGPSSPALRFLQERLAAEDGRMHGVTERVGYPLTPMLFGLPDLRGVTALPVRRYYEYLRAVSPEAASFTVQSVGAFRSALFDLAAVRYVVVSRPEEATGLERVALTPPPLPDDDAALSKVYEDPRVLILENQAALPRVRIVHHAREVPDESAALREIRALAARPGHAAELGLAASVILEPADGRSLSPPLSDGDPTLESVRIVDASSPDRLLLEAQVDAPGLVVLADTFYPGWEARVDGTLAPIHPANLLFRAVAVPAGRHTIEFRYRPRSFRYGVAASGMGALVCAFVLVRARRGRKRLNPAC